MTVIEDFKPAVWRHSDISLYEISEYSGEYITGLVYQNEL